MQCEYQVSSAMHSTVHVCDTLMFASAMQDLPPNFAVDQKMSWDHFINFGQWEARPFRFSCGEQEMTGRLGCIEASASCCSPPAVGALLWHVLL